MSNLYNFLRRNKKLILLLFFLAYITVIIFLDWIILLLNKIPYLSISGFATITDRILLLTLLGLLWYVWETRGMKNEMVTQTELEQKPIPMMYIRNINDYSEEKKQEQQEYCIETVLTDVAKKFDGSGAFGSGDTEKTFKKYIIRIRNVGKGPLFNLKVNSENFEVEKYQSQFLAPEPKGDEQSVKIKKKDGTEISGEYSELNGAIFEISYDNVNKKNYKYKYKIINVEEQKIEFLG